MDNMKKVNPMDIEDLLRDQLCLDEGEYPEEITITYNNLVEFLTMVVEITTESAIKNYKDYEQEVANITSKGI